MTKSLPNSDQNAIRVTMSGRKALMRSMPLAAFLFLGGIQSTAHAAESGLPIQRVVLYKHGVGYFERQGAVSGTETISLRFKQDQMSDVLKSLTVLDRSGGRISTIAYDSQKPAGQLLSEFAFDLRTGDVRRSMLEQLRGAEIEGEVAGLGPFSGAIIGVDTRIIERDGARIEQVNVSILTDRGEVRTADLSDLVSFRFTDPALAEEVSRFLKLLRSTHRRDEKMVDLVCQGDGPRQVFAAYTVEQPVWKATYRLVLMEQEDRPYLQGWAVVDNPSEEDWEDVELSLIAGMPVSFRQDLYTPRFRERPLLEVEEDASVSFAGLNDMGRVSPARKAGRPSESMEKLKQLGYVADGKKKSRSKYAEVAAGATLSFDTAMMESQAETVSREIGDLLEYRIDHRVTIPRNRSALLPIVTSSVDGGKVALYNESARATNPMSAVKLKNTTGVTLEGGPLTVLEADTYVGESLIDTLKPEETRYVPYAVELGVRATTKYGTDSERVHRVVVANGVMWSYYRDVSQKTYSFDNKNDEPKTVVVEHPRRNGYDLREPKASEEELDRYRFEVKLSAQARQELVVKEVADRESAWQISNVDSNAITVMQRDGKLTPELLRFLQDVVAKKSAIAALDAARQKLNQEQSAISSDQDRVRKNLAALGNSAEEKDLRRDYVEQLRSDEERVRSLKEERTALDQQLATARAMLNQLVMSASFSFEL